MCIGKDLVESKTVARCSPEAVMDGITNIAEINFQLAKPKLSRKITSTVKLNLNKYWTKFGEIMTSPSKKNLSKPVIARSSNRLSKSLFPCEIPVENKSLPFKVNINNSLQAIEELKKQRFELLQDDGCEIEDNLANEIKEICGVSATTSFYECNCY